VLVKKHRYKGEKVNSDPFVCNHSKNGFSLLTFHLRSTIKFWWKYQFWHIFQMFSFYIISIDWKFSSIIKGFA